MARSLGVSLAEAYPQVAATWLQERNGGLTPQKATPKMQVDVWWRCPAGHEWEERIANRTSLPKWKNGDVAACRECVGYRVSYTYPDCGHTVKVTPESAAKKGGAVLGLPEPLVAGERATPEGGAVGRREGGGRPGGEDAGRRCAARGHARATGC